MSALITTTGIYHRLPNCLPVKTSYIIRTRYNAVGEDLNRDHVNKIFPETQALHHNVLRTYDIDYMIDLHHQGARRERDGELVSGSILYPTTENADPEVVHKSKQLGAVVFDRIEPTGWGHLGKYNGGSAETISRNGISVEYGISTLLFEMRGMSDHFYESYVLGQKSNGYLIKQTRRKRPFSNVQTGALCNEIKETRRGTSRC